MPAHFRKSLVQELAEMCIGDPVDVLENSFPERWQNFKVLLLHLPDLEKPVQNIEPSAPTSLN